MATNNGNGTVTVVKGDTLYKIATANGTTVANLAKLNPDITDVNTIYIGQVIRITEAVDLSSITGTLTSGSTGNDVRKLQKALIMLGYSVGSSGADGVYGSSTESAIKKFQTDKGLTATGIADQDTIKTLNAACNGDTSKPKAASVPVVDKWGLVSNSDREVYAGWTWPKMADTDHFEYQWFYSWGVGVAIKTEGTTNSMSCTYSAPDYATHVSFVVRAVAKTDKDNKGNEVSRFATTQWSTKQTYWYSENPPKTPNAPDVTIKDYSLTATLDNLEDLNADSIEFHVYLDNDHRFAAETVPIVTHHASHTFTIEPGHDYKVRARSWRDDQCSDWSPFSGNKGTAPSSSSGITVIRANSTSSVYLEWEEVSNAETYDIEYTTKKEYFDSSDQTTTVSDIKTNSYIKTGLEIGKEYFFRVRAVNSNGHSAWTAPKSIILGKNPSAPTTWSSTTKAIVGEPLLLYWVHNSEDGSKQVNAEIELNVDGNVSVIVRGQGGGGSVDEDESEKTQSYEFITSGYTEGATLKWRVRTCGITGEFSEWSMQRVVDIYAKPSLSLNLFDLTGAQIETLTSFPIRVVGNAGPSTQKPIGWHLSITADSAYETIDRIGNTITINRNGVVYSEYFDIYSQLDIVLSANDMDLHNNIRYTVNCTVTMDSGLTAEANTSFIVGWDETMYPPDAAISINNDNYSAIISPYCRDLDGNLVSDVTLAVYRREFDGKFVEIARNLANTSRTFVTDPHPALDYARYRIVATSTTTGAVGYTDIMHPSFDATSVIIQWDEEWTDFETTDYGIAEDRPWSGSMLKLPYNIDTSEQNQPDVVLVEYIGRARPVSYYGTQLGGSATWNVDIDASDKETIYALRRLMNWMGDVYVREPSGTGYWANINVSFSRKHCDVVIPVTLNITRVEGGV